MAKTDIITTRSKDKVEIYNYSEKSFAVVGETFPLKNDLKALGGTFNGGLNINGKKTAGWIFSKSKEQAVRDYLESEGEPAAEKPTRTNVDAPKNTIARKEPQEKVADLPFLQWLTIYYELMDIVPKSKKYASEYAGKLDDVALRAANKTLQVGNIDFTPHLYFKNKNVFIVYNKLDEHSMRFEDKYAYHSVLLVLPSGKVLESWKVKDKIGIEPEDIDFQDGTYKSIAIPKKVAVPKEFKTPFYKKKKMADDYSKEELENYERLRTSNNEQSRALAANLFKPYAIEPRADIVKRELILGKLAYAQTSGFDGVSDSSYSIPKNEQVYTIPDLKEYRDRNFIENLDNLKYNYKNDEIEEGRYSYGYTMKYTGKPTPDYIYFPSVSATSETSKVEKELNPQDIAQKLREKAEALREQAAKKTSGGVFNQNYTHRRGNQMDSLRNQAERMENDALKLEKLADLWEDGGYLVPEQLKNVRNVADLEVLKYKYYPKLPSVGSYGYDDVRKSIDRLKKLGIKDDFQLATAREALHNISKKPDKTPEQIQKELKEQKIRELKGVKIEGFFPTPRKLALDLIYSLALPATNGLEILEPSAGKGDLAEVIKEKYPNARIDVIERMYSLREILELEGYNVVGDDFLEYNAKKYDIIFMNPPFEKGQDIDHVTHAFSLLKEGGELAAITSATAYSPDDKREKWRKFAELVDKYGEASEVITDAFKGTDSFRQTGVAVRIITLRKPKSAKNDFARIAQARATRLKQMENE